MPTTYQESDCNAITIVLGRSSDRRVIRSVLTDTIGFGRAARVVVRLVHPGDHRAHAESMWGEALQAHNSAHSESHEYGNHDELIALRVGVIIAEAEMRRVCG